MNIFVFFFQFSENDYSCVFYILFTYFENNTVYRSTCRAGCLSERLWEKV